MINDNFAARRLKKLPVLLILWMFTFLRKCSSVKYGRPFMTKGTSRMPIPDRIFQLANLRVGPVAFSDPCRILEKESAKGYVVFWLLLPMSHANPNERKTCYKWQ